jgi:hypothetical protein
MQEAKMNIGRWGQWEMGSELNGTNLSRKALQVYNPKGLLNIAQGKRSAALGKGGRQYFHTLKGLFNRANQPFQGWMAILLRIPRAASRKAGTCPGLC